MSNLGCYIRTYTRNGSEILSELTESHPVQGNSPDIYEDMSFESVANGGFSVASFTVHRDVRAFWADLQFGNLVKIGRGEQIYWEGRIDKISRGINPDAIEASCLGSVVVLNDLSTYADINVATTYKLSTFLTDVLLADTRHSLVAGTINTDDFEFTAGTRFEFAPTTTYGEAIEQMLSPNAYNWAVWEGGRLDFIPQKTGAADWIVQIEDCSSLTISDNTEYLCNRVIVDYTQDGSHHQQLSYDDAASQAKYGFIEKRIDVPGKCTSDDASYIAMAYLADCKDIKTSASYTTTRIYDIYGAEHHLGEARGGDVIYLQGWLATEKQLYGVDNITTHQARAVTFNASDYTLDITPNEFLPSTEIILARASTVGYL